MSHFVPPALRSLPARQRRRGYAPPVGCSRCLSGRSLQAGARRPCRSAPAAAGANGNGGLIRWSARQHTPRPAPTYPSIHPHISDMDLDGWPAPLSYPSPTHSEPRRVAEIPSTLRGPARHRKPPIRFDVYGPRTDPTYDPVETTVPETGFTVTLGLAYDRARHGPAGGYMEFTLYRGGSRRQTPALTCGNAAAV